MKKRLVKEIMIDFFAFPHIPYWFTIKQGIEIMKEALATTEACLRPIALLVFDEKYQLVGTVSHVDILRGLEPKFLKSPTKVEGYSDLKVDLSVLWDLLFQESKKFAERSISEIMRPVNYHVKVSDPITKAAYLMLNFDLPLLPVLDEGNKLVGVVRLLEIFEELIKDVLEE